MFLTGSLSNGRLRAGSSRSREVCAITGFALFHNHLAVDLLLSVSPFGGPEFVRHRERIRLDLIGDAVARGTSLVFTFNPERTVEDGFSDRLREHIARGGGSLRSVEVRCPDEAIEARMEACSRKEHGKPTSLALYRELKRDGASDHPVVDSELVIDSNTTSPQESARRIVAAPNLPSLALLTGFPPR